MLQLCLQTRVDQLTMSSSPGKAQDDAIMYGASKPQHIPGAFEDDTQVQGDAPVQPGVSTRHVPGAFDSDVPEGRDVPATQRVLQGSGKQELGGLNQTTYVRPGSAINISR